MASATEWLPDHAVIRHQSEIDGDVSDSGRLPRSGLLARFAGFTSASSAFADLSERFVLKMADAAAVFGNDVAVSAELVLVGR
jgi:hypothetical protein